MCVVVVVVCLFVCLVFGGRGGDEEGGVRNGVWGEESWKREQIGYPLKTNTVEPWLSRPQ